MENYSFLFYVFCFIVVITIGKIFVMPIKKIIKLIINSILGIVLINVINIVGSNYGFHLGINWWTVLASGILGIPGVVLVVVLKLFL
ncbi:MAG: pro-sigmaK processing inhibitor BofA family protein [Clostridia bacterium]|nr:pro-sigmaK processing inhibitor BofA family protein [Clostridia bacterium]